MNDANAIVTNMPWLLAMGLALGFCGVAGWVFTTWLRIRNGYPLQNGWGMAIYPKTDQQAAERITLLTQENAQLRAEIGSIKDRLVTVERIVTDGDVMLSHEIDRLRDRAN